jgi:hypothetical protein
MATTPAINWTDPKLIVAFCTALFCAGGAWVSIAYIGDDVKDLAAEVDAETEARIEGDAGITAAIDEMADDVQRTAENMARVCQALSVDCR